MKPDKERIKMSLVWVYPLCIRFIRSTSFYNAFIWFLVLSLF